MARWLTAACACGAVLVVAFLWSLTSAATVVDRDIQAGQQLFARQCAPCHGSGGRGDGSSASGLATKPADLTDGRIMNSLPDEFLLDVILNGGPAEGLAPTMPPFRGHLSEDQAQEVIAHLRTLARPPFKPGAALPIVSAASAPRQPIFFSHLIHAGSFKIDCQYCHADARRSQYAGLPSVERCMGCHKIIGAQDNPEIAKLHDYWNQQRPVPWVRVFKVPEFTHFPHKAHIRAEITCQTCHGPVERMRVVGARTGPRLANDLAQLVGLRAGPPPLSMGWCVDCHRRQNLERRMHAPLDCVGCHH